RFFGWGWNISTWPAMGPPAEVEKMLTDVRDSGANCVRIPHHWDYLNAPNRYCYQNGIPANPLSRTYTTDQLDERYMVKVDWIAKVCEDLGLYIWLDIYNRTQLTGADKALLNLGDELWTRPVTGAKPGEPKGYFWVYPVLQREVSNIAIKI